MEERAKGERPLEVCRVDVVVRVELEVEEGTRAFETLEAGAIVDLTPRVLEAVPSISIGIVTFYKMTS